MGSDAINVLNFAVVKVVNFVAGIVGTGSQAGGEVGDAVFGSLGATPRP